MLHGCIPVVVMDEVHAVLESILDWDRFGLRITEKRYWTGYATTVYNVMWVIVCNVQKNGVA